MEAQERFFEVSLKRSLSGRPERQRSTLAGLGLFRMGKKVHVLDTPANRGMLYKVVHLVDVKPCEKVC